MEKRFYVYMYIDPITWEPFYVGKGTGSRKFKHLKETKDNTENYMKYCHIIGLRNKGYEPWVITYKDKLTNDEAESLETKKILEYGRKNIEENGILTNRTIDSNPPITRGKDHCCYGIGPRKKYNIQLTDKMRETYRNNLSKAHIKNIGREPWNKGKTGLYKHSPEIRAILSEKAQNRPPREDPPWNKGLTKETDERLANISKNNTGKKLSEETKNKIKAKRALQPPARILRYIIEREDGTIEDILNMTQYFKDKGLAKPHYLSILNTGEEFRPKRGKFINHPYVGSKFYNYDFYYRKKR